MAIGTPKFPLDEITGVLGKVDRSVSRAKGLGLNISASKKSSILGVKTQRTTTRTLGQQERTKIYCDCDHGWAAMGLFKQLHTCKYQREVRQKSSQRYTHYTCWMSLCLTDAWDENLFLLNSYVSRYVIKNTSGAPWIDHKVTLTDIPTKQANGWDVAIMETDYKREPRNYLDHKVNDRGAVIVCLPDMNPGRTIYVDVYSYGDYSTPQNCPAVSEADLMNSLIDNISMDIWDWYPTNGIDVTLTPTITGPLYLLYPKHYWWAGVDVNLTTNTPKNEFGLSGAWWFHDLPVDVWTFGVLTAGETYHISGSITESDSWPDTCNEGNGSVCAEFNYHGPYSSQKHWVSPGLYDTCNSEYVRFDMLQLIGESYTEIAPESTTKIGPT